MSDTLAFWMYSADGQVNSISFGNAPRRSSSDVMFRLVNASTSYTANAVTVFLRGSRSTSYYLSLDGESFAAAVDMGDMAPGTYTEGITLRRITPPDAALGKESIEVVAAATSWTT